MLLKPGICKPANLLDPKKKGSPISYALLYSHETDEPGNVEAFEAVVHSMRLSNGVYRTTYPGRLRDIDERVQALLEKRFISSDPLHIHDLGASDCLATAEWAEVLFTAFPNCTLIASDLSLSIREHWTEWGELFYFEPDGHLLQYVRPPFVIPLDPSWSNGDVVNRLLQRAALWRFKRMCHYLGGRPASKPLSLVHPRAAKLTRQEGRFQTVEHSVFDPLPSPCHVVRTMNVLNLAYFSRARLEAAIENIWSCMHTGGIWIVGRTSENTSVRETRATIFERSESGFVNVLDLNGGAELSTIVSEGIWSRAVNT